MKTPYVLRFHSKLEKQSQKLALCTVNSTMQCLQKEQLYLSKWYMLGRGNRKKAASGGARGTCGAWGTLCRKSCDSSI